MVIRLGQIFNWNLLVLLLAVIMAGCSSGMEQVKVTPEQLNAHLTDKPKLLHSLYEKELVDGPRNEVLNNMQIGLAAMEINEWRLAEQAFDEALTGIEAVFANDERAENARGYWRKEGSKAFKGEPYERVMAYYYRGILYMRAGDFENARACFKAGILQDAFAEEEQNQCDFALMMFLSGWCSRILGAEDLAKEAWAELKEHRPNFQLPPPDHDVLVIAETGLSPRKEAGGQQGEVLLFKPGEDFAEEKVVIKLHDKLLTTFPMEDIAWQATTRGGRPMDGLLKGQVLFKNVNQAMGQTLTVAGIEAMNQANYQNNSNMAYVGAAMALIGLIQMVVAEAVRPEADTRYWSNLPDSVHVATYKLNPARDNENIEVVFQDSNGAAIAGLTRKTSLNQINLDNGKTAGLVWIHSRPTIIPAATE